MKRLCKRKTYDIASDRGECPENCPYGAWHLTPEGICGAECLECGGTLYLTDTGKIYCDGCGFQEDDL